MKFRVLIMAVSLVFAGCSGAAGKLKLVEGSFLQSRQFYAEAIDSYTAALGSDETRAYANYALGSVYLELAENDAALARFDAAEQSFDALHRQYEGAKRELAYRLRYNRGIVHFQAGDYGDASANFRQALEIDGSRVEAKRNLELSLLSLQRQNQAQARRQIFAGDEESKRGNDILFDFIREQESAAWKTLEWQTDSGDVGPDH
jgi:Ca-activated chloride channel family protein